MRYSCVFFYRLASGWVLIRRTDTHLEPFDIQEGLQVQHPHLYIFQWKEDRTQGVWSV